MKSNLTSVKQKTNANHYLYPFSPSIQECWMFQHASNSWTIVQKSNTKAKSLVSSNRMHSYQHNRYLVTPLSSNKIAPVHLTPCLSFPRSPPCGANAMKARLSLRLIKAEHNSRCHVGTPQLSQRGICCNSMIPAEGFWHLAKQYLRGLKKKWRCSHKVIRLQFEILIGSFTRLQCSRVVYARVQKVITGIGES